MHQGRGRPTAAQGVILGYTPRLVHDRAPARMHDFEPRSSVIRLRARLARRLTWWAIGGVAAVLATGLLVLVVAAACAARAWLAIESGQPVETVMWVGAMLVMALAAVGLLNALSTGVPVAEGVRLPRAVAPDLFALLDELAAQTAVAPVHVVRITGEINAAVMQRPALNLVGPLRTELLVGLPLVHSVSPEQFAAVLAHEFGHLAAQRRGRDGWSAHVRAWWARILNAVIDDEVGDGSWLDRAAERYFLDMQRLARMEEFEADAVAARLVGAELVGETLVELSRKAHFLEHDYWPRVQALRSSDAGSRVRPFREMGHGVLAGYAQAAAACADVVEGVRDRRHDLHPTPRRRLRALRVACRQFQLPLPQGAGSAAERFFAGLVPTLAWVFDREWCEYSRSPRHPMLGPEQVASVQGFVARR